MTAVGTTVWERRTAAPLLVFDLIDRFIRQRGTAGGHPRVRGAVRFRIIATEANNVRTDVTEPLEMVMAGNASGYHMWFGLVRDEGPFTRRYPLQAPGSIVVEVAAEGHQRAETVIPPLPRGDTPQQLELEPGWAYPFPTVTATGARPTLLRGTLRNPDGSGIADARVRVNPPPPNQAASNPEYVTDASGNWVLPFDDAVATTHTARVEIEREGQPAVVIPEVTITRGDTAALRHASLRGVTRRVTSAALGGVTFTVDVVPGISTVSDADGDWELWLPLNRFPPSAGPQPAVVTATPPQGAPLVGAAQVHPRTTTRVDPFVFP